MPMNAEGGTTDLNTAPRSERTETPQLSSEAIQQIALDALAEAKAQDVVVLDVRNKTSITDSMIVASGSSSRHVKTLAERVSMAAKAAGLGPVRTEGERDAEWVLVDLTDVLVHVMLPRTRDFYNLEGLWAVGPDSERAPG